MLGYGIALAVGLVIAAVLVFVYRRWLAQRRRILWEDALKQIASAENEERPITNVEIAGRLKLSTGVMHRLASELEAAGLLSASDSQLELTERGRKMGVQVLRGHRLWEHYLSSDGQVPLGAVHGAAERVEHSLTSEDVDALADHLGHPRTDPHGDVVPSATDSFASRTSIPLTEWPLNEPALVVHVEDEPPENLRAALSHGLQPGSALRPVERGAEAVVCDTPVGRRTLPRHVAESIDVGPPGKIEAAERPATTLADLPLGEGAEILGLADACAGLARRRLLDLGFTTGTRVRAVLSNLEDEAHGYEIRGTMIALRREQAEQVLVKLTGEPAHRPLEVQGIRR